MRTHRTRGQVRCLRLQTTLYELIEALQEEVPAEQDHVVSAVVAQWLDEGRIKASRGVRWRVSNPVGYRQEPYRLSMERAS